MAIDPTYPLFPIVALISCVMLLHVLGTGLVRQSWNFGVMALCFGLFWLNLTFAVSHIVWAHSADLKAYVYCDIATHIQIFVAILRPASTLIITRRLYLILAEGGLHPPSRREVGQLAFLAISLTTPLSIIDYIVQSSRFGIMLGVGCFEGLADTYLSVLLLGSWSVTLPLISCTFFPAWIVWQIIRRRREIAELRGSNGTAISGSYFRILAIASLDILLTLPSGIAQFVLNLVSLVEEGAPFYSSWAEVHQDFAPISVSGTGGSPASLALTYLTFWMPVVLALLISLLIGTTRESFERYQLVFRRIATSFGFPRRRCSTGQDISFIILGARGDPETAYADLLRRVGLCV
ncbi:GPCR fungal pheromone mating factor [Vararia minispora EC-137]|uniref:GPCR fungal pheromone mating factor n=1 Tax=Vararia minispora EC-137 TaxID=1314806 RepID=A0ACB8QP55_9AGAM|nr:GPCR fungal pheromone mating factor [Vararia minispora EC-137]